MAFGITIVATALVISLVIELSGAAGGWRQDMERVRRFASNQLAAVWTDAPRRHALVEGVARDLDVGITLYDASGVQIESAGGVCERKPTQVRVFEPGTNLRLGRAEVCTGSALHGAGHGPLEQRFLLAFGAALMTIWMASGIIAHKLARPLVDVADVAREIGRGRLRARVRLEGPHKDDEAGILADALHDAAARIDKQLADQRALLAAVSHEIRTPLARMRLLVELASLDPAKLAELDAEIVELDVLVADLLAGARVDFSALKPVSIDGAKLAREALERHGLGREFLEVEGNVTIEGDATLLSRAVSNLVQNALKHAGGVDKVRVVGSDTRVSFEVLDRGPGLLKGEETQIFEPFYRRAQTDETAAMGTFSVGLGLALVRRIAEAHGGRAFAENRAGGGARIAFNVRN